MMRRLDLKRPLAAGLTVVFALAAGALASPASAEGTRGIHAWVTVDAVRPAVGCSVGVAVEVREAGEALTDTEVSIALFVDDAPVASDRSLTDGAGLAHLSVDTGGTYAGADGWLDVNIAGGYVGGLSLFPGGDRCDGEGASLALTAEVPEAPGGGRSAGGDASVDISIGDVTISGSGDISVDVDVGDTTGGGAQVHDEDAAVSAGPTANGAGVFLPVGTHGQERTLSCEYAALQIATGAVGDEVPEAWFVDVVGRSENPHWGFRGDIDGAWGGTDDYGVYAEALVPALDAFGFHGEAFYGGGDLSALTERLDRGMPTLVWIGRWGDTAYDASTEDGTRFKLAAGMHVVVAYGYDREGVYVSDPARAAYDYYEWGDFLAMWAVLDGMGLAVAPY